MRPWTTRNTNDSDNDSDNDTNGENNRDSDHSDRDNNTDNEPLTCSVAIVSVSLYFASRAVRDDSEDSKNCSNFCDEIRKKIKI